MCNGLASEGRGCGPTHDCVASSLLNRGPSLSLGIFPCLPARIKEKVIMNDQAIAVVSMTLVTRALYFIGTFLLLMFNSRIQICIRSVMVNTTPRIGSRECLFFVYVASFLSKVLTELP